MKIENGIKSMNYRGSVLFFYYSNNSGRGTNNVTIYRVTKGTERAGNCKNQERLPFIAKTQTSGWSGNVNFSERVINSLFKEVVK